MNLNRKRKAPLSRINSALKILNVVMVVVLFIMLFKVFSTLLK